MTTTGRNLEAPPRRDTEELDNDTYGPLKVACEDDVVARHGARATIVRVDRTCGLARRFADGMRAAGHTVANDVVLNQVIVDFGDQAHTNAVVAAVREEGTCWCGPTTWCGHAAMRVSVSCWNTTEEDVDRSVAAVLTCASR